MLILSSIDSLESWNQRVEPFLETGLGIHLEKSGVIFSAESLIGKGIEIEVRAGVVYK